MINKIKDMMRDESGVIAIMFAIMLPLFLAFAAIAIDMAYAYKVRNMTQVTASAAALASVSQLNDSNGNHNPNDDDVPNNASEEYRREAIEYAYRNMINDGNIINSACGSFDETSNLANYDDVECDDIKAGYWSGEQFYAWDAVTYDPEIMDLNSVQVVTRRAASNTNPLQLFFAATLGLSETDINTTAVAKTDGGVVSNGCLIALNNEAGSDQTFHLNGTASVSTVGCDIRVDQCCAYPGGCAKGALRANGIPDVTVIANSCVEGDLTCVEEAGIIDVCGTVLSQGSVELDPIPQCNPDANDGPNFVDCLKGPTEDFYDPLSELATDNAEWNELATSECDFNNFEITKLNDPTYEYYSPDDVTIETTTTIDPVTGETTVTEIKTYTIYPGTYCGNGSTNAKAIKFAGGGSDPNIVFADGIFVMKNGKMDLAGSGNISCDACGFFLTGDPATLDWTGSNNIDMTAINDPDNPMHGLLVVQDPFPPTTEDQEIKIAGSNEGSYYGGFYLPNADVNIVGTAGSFASEGEDGCLYIIADELEFSGTSSLQANNSCKLFGGTDFTASPLFFTLAN